MGRDLLSCGFVQVDVKPFYSRYVCVTNLMRWFPKTVRLVEKLKNETVNENATATGDTLGAAYLENAFLSSADEKDVLLYIKAAPAHRRARKQIPTFNDRVCYSYATLPLQKLRIMQRTACKKHPVCSYNSMLIEIPKTVTFSLL